MSTVCIVQARMTSARLPGKVLLPLAGEPMLACVVERLRRARGIDSILVATTVHSPDDAVVQLCHGLGLPCHRGSEADVLARYHEAAQAAGATHVVRVTSDCPLVDPQVLDQVVTAYHAGGFDYASNTHPQTWPHGLAVEVFSRSVLQEAAQLARDPQEREHVTPYLYWRPQRFRLHNVTRPGGDLSQHRWTVDTWEDYELVRRIFEALHAQKPAFGVADVLGLLQEHPDWADLNRDVQQKTLRRPA